ncbi:MAG: SpoIIE family protein phosphatase [Planctomycetota bacterium]
MGGEKPKKTILIVDDSPENLRILSNLLKGEYRLMAATNGAKALELAMSESKPDLVLLDVMMPEMDGREVCRRLKGCDDTREIPVIFITAMSEVEDEAHGFALGAVDYITKPFNPTIVEARVRTHLDLKEKNEIITQEREELRVAHELLTKAINRLQADIRLAAEIQKNMLPDSTKHPFPEALTIVTRYNPEMDVGGDFFDFAAPDDKHASVILADVAGHGLQAAFITGLIKTSFELAGKALLTAAGFANDLNEILCRLTPPNSFATVVYCLYDLHERRLHYFNGGHGPWPIFVTPQGKVGPISQKTNVLLGIFEKQEFKEEVFDISPGSKLILATDGLVDALNPQGESFGYERLMSTIGRHSGVPAKDLDRIIFQELETFTHGADQNDDIAAVTIEFH